MLQDEVGHRDQSVFLAKQFAVLLDEDQTVNVRVDDHAKVASLLLDIATDVGEVLRQRFGSMGELTRRLTIEFEHLLHAECAQHLWDGDTTRRVDRIHGHLEIGLLDHLLVDQRQLTHHFDMLVHPAVNQLIAADFLNRDKIEVILGGNVEQPCTFGGGDELALLVEELQGVPLCRIVAGSEDDASIGLQAGDGNLSRRCRAQPDVKHIGAHGLQGATDHLVHKETRKTGVTADHDLGTFHPFMMLHEFDKCCGEFHHVDWRKVVARLAANGTTNAGY